ncbi:hypothetical protein D3C85_1639970 [compost metagenome]
MRDTDGGVVGDFAVRSFAVVVRLLILESSDKWGGGVETGDAEVRELVDAVGFRKAEQVHFCFRSDA